MHFVVSIYDRLDGRTKHPAPVAHRYLKKYKNPCGIHLTCVIYIFKVKIISLFLVKNKKMLMKF